MWVVLVSCLRVGVDKKLVSAVQADESCLVTIQHARSLNEKSLVVSARGGCISNNKAILCLQGAADKLICLDLSRTLAPAAGRQSVKTAFDDLEPMVLWSTDLPPSEVTVPGVFPAPGAGIVCLKSGQIGVITANGMTYMCNSLNGQLLVFRQISDSRILSSSSTPANGVVYCLSEKGNMFKLCFK